MIESTPMEPKKKTTKYICPSCGFNVFQEPPGSFEICPLCDWEDDRVQLRLPGFAGGANKKNLYQHQFRSVKAIPLHIREHQGYHRDENWRPLREDERVADGPGIGSESAPYYWKAEGPG
jgi:hypothetical protein